MKRDKGGRGKKDKMLNLIKQWKKIKYKRGKSVSVWVCVYVGERKKEREWEERERKLKE